MALIIPVIVIVGGQLGSAAGEMVLQCHGGRLAIGGFRADSSEKSLGRAADPDQLVIIDRLAIDDVFGQLLGSEGQGCRLFDQTALGFGEDSADLGLKRSHDVPITPSRRRAGIDVLMQPRSV
jgi:hypothetical protein